jgi:hypothetical protein
MRRLWVFRSNLRILEYYHKYTDLKTFKLHCHDYYLLFPLWLLENDYFDEVTIWRLTDQPKKNIIFKLNNGKFFNQVWCENFSEVFKYPSSEMSFFRGGFKEYDKLTKQNPNHFGKKLYLGAGKRITSQWDGIYDAYLMEDERDFIKGKQCIPFYKTASPSIFKPFNLEKKWDICWPCNFSQLKYKGQKFFINLLKKYKELQNLKIVHCGNNSHIGKKMCDQNKITNIEFLGSIDRVTLNEVLNMSKFGLNLSNLKDGCPRISTEILMSGTPLIIRDSVRLMKYFKQQGVVEVNDINIISKILESLTKYNILKNQTIGAINTILSFNEINKKNIEIWKKI